MTTPLKIAVVEDHSDLRELFIDFLRGGGHDAAGFTCADELDEHIADAALDLLVLDLNLPGEDGFSIAQRLRAAHPELNIIMLTARTAVEDRIKGYASGADIYLTKPVTPPELGAAIGSIVRRVEASQLRMVRLVLDTASLRISGAAGTTSLSLPEVHLLKGLAEAPGRRLDYWRLQELLQLEPDEKGKAALEVRVSRLKKKLREAGASEPAIKPLWKKAYQLCVPVSIQN